MGEKLKFGVFGTWRGLAFIKSIGMQEDAEVTAICDCDPEKIREAIPACPAGVKVCADFDELIKSGIDAVVLCNYFNEHAPYAIRAMRAGIDVLSETTAASTLKECVELAEAVEETGRTYALAENYPFFRANMEMARVYKSGVLGNVIFAEGEYVHPMSSEESAHFTPSKTHWRYNNPKTYYLSHSLAPLMTITGLMPKRVIGKVAERRDYAVSQSKTSADGAGIMLVEMDGGALFRIAGSCSFGSRGNWYRLGCEKGGIESLRGTNDKVRLAINEWELTDATRQMGTECVYSPEMTELDRKAQSFGHEQAGASHLDRGLAVHL